MSRPRDVWGLISVILVLAVLCPRDGEPLAAAEPEAAAPDAATAKQDILNGAAWAEATHAFNEWLSVQIVYPQEQVPQLKASLQARVDKMSARELTGFLADLQQKLTILSGPEALEARSWAEQRLKLLSAAKAAEFRKSLPDVANMTALQVEQALEDLKQHRAANAASYSAFERFRNEEVAAAHAQHQAQAKADAATAALMNRGGGSGYHPGFSGGPYAPRSIQRYPGIGAGGWRGGYGW